LTAEVRAPAVQLAPRHPVLVDQALHAPAPLQVPSLEQSPPEALLALHRPLGSAPPEETGRQLPTLPVTLQVLHRPVAASSLHALSQHTPSVQWPLTHCVLAVQAAPSAFSPHELPAQVLGDTQSLSCLQTELHAPLAQAKVPQEAVLGVEQVPLPSHLEAAMAEDEVGQLAALQLVPLSKLAQAPPMQRPVVPQVLA
jgi:hypothetical protein